MLIFPINSFFGVDLLEAVFQPKKKNMNNFHANTNCCVFVGFVPDVFAFFFANTGGVSAIYPCQNRTFK